MTHFRVELDLNLQVDEEASAVIAAVADAAVSAGTAAAVEVGGDSAIAEEVSAGYDQPRQSRNIARKLRDLYDHFV